MRIDRSYLSPAHVAPSLITMSLRLRTPAHKKRVGRFLLDLSPPAGARPWENDTSANFRAASQRHLSAQKAAGLGAELRGVEVRLTARATVVSACWRGVGQDRQHWVRV